ncbi:MAG: DUF6043 family protein [Alistipes sp.]|nr:DUF6043 family protein [Alistipes sp.]
MAEKDFDNFKQQLREWMESHPAEYDWFEAEMNRKDDAGYQMVLAQAVALVPEYQKIISKRINSSPNEDISDIEQFFTENKLTEKLIGEFDKAPSETIVPTMLCWLYFGQSFERMVERGEELRKNPEIPFHQRMAILLMIKILVKRSVKLGLRTKEDWKKQHSAMQLADSKDSLVLAINEPTEKRKRGRPSTKIPLPEMFSSSVRSPKKLIGKLGDYLTAKNSQLDIARLKIALDELRFIISPVDIKSFRDALAEQFEPDIHIIHERGIQEAYSRLSSTISTQNKRVADIGEDRAAIDEIKKFLRS